MSSQVLPAQAKELFQYLFEQASLGIAVEDIEGTLLRVNPALCSMMGYTENELCHLLSGRICLRDAQGTAYDFGAGDTFLICSGFAGVWEVLEPCVKLYAIYDPQ